MWFCVCVLFGRHRPNPAAITRRQALKESVPASVRRFRELGLMNKGSGPRVNVQAAAKFLQLCFRSMSYGVHAFQTCLLLEQVTHSPPTRPGCLPATRPRVRP